MGEGNEAAVKCVDFHFRCYQPLPRTRSVDNQSFSLLVLLPLVISCVAFRLILCNYVRLKRMVE